MIDKHTPGPWDYAAGYVWIDKPEPNKMICKVHLGEDQEANGRLMASAPELLGALQELASNDDLCNCDEYGHYGEGHCLSCRVSIVTEAIAKATGKDDH